MREKAGIFKDTDAAVDQESQKVAAYVEQRYPDNQSRERFLDGADLWIIAHAIAKGGSVVTHEQRNPIGSKKAKIPNVCDHFNVRCIDVYQMLRHQSIARDRLPRHTTADTSDAVQAGGAADHTAPAWLIGGWLAITIT